MRKATAEDALDLLAEALRSNRTFNGRVSLPFRDLVAGGFELTLACDLRVSAPNAWFALPEVSKV